MEKYDGGGRSRLVVVDDGSRDNTHEILTSYARENPLLVPLTKENGGHGAAILYGYRYSIEHGADYIFQTDSDGQTLPEEFGQFWQRRKAYDMVIGVILMKHSLRKLHSTTVTSSIFLLTAQSSGRQAP